jgi:ribosomal protein S18 acetylase RimI-like enzyme
MKIEAEMARTALSLLKEDPIWGAYAIADLDPDRVDACEFWVAEDSFVLIYHGLNPPHLFAYGNPIHLEGLFHHVPNQEYQYALLPIHLTMLRDRLQLSTRNEMWRMNLAHPDKLERDIEQVKPLDSASIGQIEQLAKSNADFPDAFDPLQIQDGHFYGIEIKEALVAMAGTHVVSDRGRVAAVGNVFTLGQYRGRGYAKRVSSAVCKSLIDTGIKLIVLNVEMDNPAAIQAYQAIGFMPFCGYYEGFARKI